MKFPVSRPQLLSAAGTTLRSIQIVALPAVPAAGLLPQTGIDGKPLNGKSVADGSLLTLNYIANFSDAASANVIWTAPLSALTVGSTVHVATTTSNGLVCSSCPSGVGCVIDFG